ncbi:MAG: VWA domain-containing protein [Pseudomonadota bacterium]
MISLDYPWVFFLLPLPWLVWRFMPAYRYQAPAIRIPFFRTITEMAGIEPSSGSVVLERNRIQMIAAVLIWFCLVLALASPQRLGEPVVISKSARDIVIALDISGSMDQRDFVSTDGQPVQRLAAVKSVVSDFIGNRQDDRMALIVFGTRAFVQAPFTEDLDGLQGFLDQTVVGLAGPNTALGDAIGLSIRTFDASEIEQRVLILLSDGSDTSSTMTPVNAAALARDRGVTIFTIGVGDPEATGENKVDLATLRDVADRTGGQFFFADDEDGLQDVYATIDELNPRITETTSFRPRQSLVHIPLGIALIVLIAATALLHFRSTVAAER